MSYHKLMMQPVRVNFVQVRRALPPDVFAKNEQRQAEHAVVEANIAGLVSPYVLQYVANFLLFVFILKTILLFVSIIS